MRNRAWALAAAIAAIVCTGAVAFAEVPKLISYQGVLTDGSGVAVADGEYAIEFSLYTSPSGVQPPVWTELMPVQVTKGVFNAILGNLVPLWPYLFNQPLYLGISVGSGSELPRQLLTASPYALAASEIRGQNVFASGGNVGIGTANPSHPLEVESSGQVGFQCVGKDPNWASIYVSATQPSACPGYGYIRQSLKAHTYVAANDNWRLMVGSAEALSASPAGNVTIGGWTTGTERLTVMGGIALGNSSGTLAGTMRWSGSDFEGYDGSTWKSFTAAGGGGLPSGTYGQTLRSDGLSWLATSNLYNDGVNVGIGTTSPIAPLEIRKDIDGVVNLRIVNENPGPNSGIRVSLDDEDGSLAGWTLWDDENASYPSHMRLFNRRSGGSLHLLSELGSITLASSGNIGINAENPDATLDVRGGNWDLASTEGDLRIGDDVNRLRIGVATAGAGAGISRIYSNGTQGKLILGANSVEGLTVAPTGVEIGSTTQTGRLRLYRSGAAAEVIEATSNVDGGELSLQDESGNETMLMLCDPDGGGGYFSVYRATGIDGFIVDGNSGGTSDPRVTVVGAARAAIFDMSIAGSGAVSLPSSTISAPEIADETGAVAFTDGVSTFTLGPAMSTIGSQTISAPAAGYVLVMASAQFEIMHMNGVISDAIVGVSNSALTLPTNQDIRVLLQGAMPGGLYAFPVTAHAIFSVAAGANTFYLLGREDGGDIKVYDVQLSCVFIPTAYGSVEPPAAGVAGSSDENAPVRGEIDVAAQRAASIAADNERIQAELDEMRAELAEVKARLGNR